jgi:hypothetical protein
LPQLTVLITGGQVSKASRNRQAARSKLAQMKAPEARRRRRRNWIAELARQFW